jgi:hypothetical protein
MYNVSITRLRVRSIFLMPLFMLHAMRTMTQAQKAEGVRGVETRFEKNNVVWTKTVWTDEAAMKTYRSSGAHQIAMRLLSEICNEASVARWQQADAQLPTWEEAHQQMLSNGKLSKVKYPSALQVAGRTAPEMMQSGFKMPAPPV